MTFPAIICCQLLYLRREFYRISGSKAGSWLCCAQEQAAEEGRACGTVWLFPCSHPPYASNWNQIRIPTGFCCVQKPHKNIQSLLLLLWCGYLLLLVMQTGGFCEICAWLLHSKAELGLFCPFICVNIETHCQPLWWQNTDGSSFFIFDLLIQVRQK